MKIENPTSYLIDYQLSIIGKTTEDCEGVENWYNKFTLTDKQFETVKDQAIKLFYKRFRSKKMAERAFETWNLMYGLRILNK